MTEEIQNVFLIEIQQSKHEIGSREKGDPEAKV